MLALSKCAFVASQGKELPFFASKIASVILGLIRFFPRPAEGVQKRWLGKAKKELTASIQKGRGLSKEKGVPCIVSRYFLLKIGTWE